MMTIAIKKQFADALSVIGNLEESVNSPDRFISGLYCMLQHFLKAVTPLIHRKQKSDSEDCRTWDTVN
jgi:hypothetical protein